MLRKIRETIIRAISEADTVYVGRGVYRWVNFDHKLVIRSEQRVVAFGPNSGYTNTIDTEQAWDNWEKWLERSSSITFFLVLEEELEKYNLMPELTDLIMIRELKNRSKN